MYYILDSFKKTEWSNYLNKLSESQQDIYFTPEYYEIYENNKDGQSKCFVFEDQKNIAIYPFLQNSINKLGYILDGEYFDIQGAYGYNGVISNCYDMNFISKYHSTFNNYCNENNIITEFTRFHPLIGNHNFSFGFKDIIKDRRTIYLDLSQTVTELWDKSYSSTNRNMIRKALKNNVEVAISSQPNDYTVFYEIYLKRMQDLNALPYLYFSEKYFYDLSVLINDHHKLIIAKYNNEIIGGMILITFKHYAHYHLSCRKSEFGKFALNNLLLDFAIKYAKSIGCKVFHFGGGNSISENDPLFRFKMNFSSNFSDFFVGKKIYNQCVYDKILVQWKEMHPESYEKNRSKLLGYRELS